MRHLYLIFLTIFASTCLSFGQQEATTSDGKKVLLFEDSTWIFADTDPLYYLQPTNLGSLEIPKTLPNEIIISHTAYALSYNETHEQANWVAYELTSEETKSAFERTDKFLRDPKVKKGTANDKDYAGSGYDRGHLAPASDMGWSATSMAESFYYSNISPQDPSFNRGIWKRLEELARTWAVENTAIYIVTGGVLGNDLSTIGKNKVAVPAYFYKVILDYNEPSIKGIGFIFPNVGSSEPLQNYAVTIDSVEKLTGIDFFPLLPDEQENIIENTLNLKIWTWKSSKSTNDTEKEKASVSVQCNGTTKAGTRCKNKTLNVSGFCHLHEGQSPNDSIQNEKEIEKNSTSVQCSGTTKAGQRCKKKTLSKSGFCNLHEGQKEGYSGSSEPEEPIQKPTEKQTGTTKTGIPTYTGPRGGTYHYSKSGKKVYERKK